MSKNNKRALPSSSEEEDDDDVVIVEVPSCSDNSESDEEDRSMALTRGSGQNRTFHDFSIVSNPDCFENLTMKADYKDLGELTTGGKELFIRGMLFPITRKESDEKFVRATFGPIKEWAIEYGRIPIISVLLEIKTGATEWVELIAPSLEYFARFNETYHKVSSCHALVNLLAKYPKQSYDFIVTAVCRSLHVFKQLISLQLINKLPLYHINLRGIPKFVLLRITFWNIHNSLRNKLRTYRNEVLQIHTFLKHW